jgi:hypothetical protein
VEITVPLPVSGGGVDGFEEVGFSDAAPGPVVPEGSSVTLGSAVASVVPPSESVRVGFMVSSLVPEEDSCTSGGKLGTGISTLGSGNCSGGGEAGCEKLDSVSSVGRADGGDKSKNCHK